LSYTRQGTRSLARPDASRAIATGARAGQPALA